MQFSAVQVSTECVSPARSVDAAHAIFDGGRVLKHGFRSIIQCVTPSGNGPGQLGDGKRPTKKATSTRSA
jgi:hypothetical protein